MINFVARLVLQVEKLRNLMVLLIMLLSEADRAFNFVPFKQILKAQIR